MRLIIQTMETNTTDDLADNLTPDAVLELFKQSGALLTGHFVLTSGKHSDTYFEKFNVLHQPVHVETLCRALARKIAPHKPDVILGPTTLGVLLAYETAKKLGLPAAYGEKGPDNSRILRRPEHIAEGMRVAIVDDVLTTGGSIKECISLVQNQNAVLCAVGVLVDRSGGGLDFGTPLEALLPLRVEAFAPDAVPAWLQAVPVSRPGSTGKK